MLSMMQKVAEKDDEFLDTTTCEDACPGKIFVLELQHKYMQTLERLVILKSDVINYDYPMLFVIQKIRE